jgi:hypothetical protein
MNRILCFACGLIPPTIIAFKINSYHTEQYDKLLDKCNDLKYSIKFYERYTETLRMKYVAVCEKYNEIPKFIDKK